MSAPLELLNGIGTQALPVLAGTAVAAAEVGSAILGKVWEWWTKKVKEAERRRELETLASMTGQQVKEAVRELVDKIASNQPQSVKSRLTGYLLAVPAQVRRTLRRPSDSSGRTVPPELALNRIEDLAPLLPPRPPRFAPGDKVPGTDFELVELLGIGGFGEVWKAKNAFMPGAPLVALKFCLDADAATSLRRETALLDRIQREGKHPGIVELRHTFLSVEPPFLEYELVEGGDLGGLILDWHRKQGGPSAAQAADVIRRLAEVVAFAHSKGIVHRDLKPANILLANGRREPAGVPPEEPAGLHRPFALKVADFGIGGIAAEAAARQARLTLASSTLTAAAAHGSYSLYYASPEQMRGAAPDPRDDVHAIGVIWYQLLVGDLTAEAPRGPGWKKRLAAKGMPVDLVELLEACVASEREDRPKDAKEVADRLAFSLAEPPPSIDLMAPAALKTPSPPPTPIPLAAVSSPTASQGDVPFSVAEVEGALKKSRWLDFIEQLRAIRMGHNRLRWSRGMLCWLLPFACCAAIGGVIGAQTCYAIERESYAYNAALGRELAFKASKPNMAIQFENANYYPAFKLQLLGSYTRLPNKPDPRAYLHGGYYNFETRSSSRDATYLLMEVDTTNSPPADQRSAVERYIADVNEALGHVTSEYNSQRRGRNAFWYGVLAGAPTGIVLFIGYFFVRWWRVRRLRADQRELVADMQTHYGPELRALPEPVDLNQPAAVHRFLTAMEGSGVAPKPMLPQPAWLWHRFFAPF